MRGISRQRVFALKEDGRIPLDDDGLVIVKVADANLAAMLDRSRANRAQQIADAASYSMRAGPPHFEPTQSTAEDADRTHGQVPGHIAVGPPAAQGSTAGTLAVGPAEEPAVAPPGGVRLRQDTNAGEAYWESKAKRETAEAELAQLRLREKLGELVAVDGVQRSRRETAFRVANALNQLPAKLAPVVAPQDPLRAQKALADEIERILLELSADLDAVPESSTVPA